tara:strand:+ start:77 stop:229 length:153 start_codon:yes stop_codon:yes gene_type:complete
MTANIVALEMIKEKEIPKGELLENIPLLVTNKKNYEWNALIIPSNRFKHP